jgi:hypothetical protein
MVWVSPNEQSLSPVSSVFYPDRGIGNYFCDSLNHKIMPSTHWNVHMCVSTEAPYTFYLWTTYQDTNITDYMLAQKQATINPGSATNSNTTISNVHQIYDSLSFFAMDGVDDIALGDTDNVVFWCDVSGGAPSHKTGYYPATMSNINELLPSTGVSPNPYYCIRSWYKKPTTFTNRNDFLNQFEQMRCGFLPTAVLMYQAVQPYETGSSKQIITLIPGNLSSNIYTSKSEIYPMMYGRGSVQYQNQVNYNPIYNGVLKEPFKLPPSYKGVSKMMRLSGSDLPQFSLLNDGAEPKKWICAGRWSAVIIPWNGVSIANVM